MRNKHWKTLSERVRAERFQPMDTVGLATGRLPILLCAAILGVILGFESVADPMRADSTTAGFKSGSDVLPHSRSARAVSSSKEGQRIIIRGGEIRERTIVVKAHGTALENGWELLSAVAGIDAPSSTNRYLIQLEPGIYDLGSGELSAKPWVDIAGAGQSLTTISSRASNGGSTIRISMIDVVSLRNLEVINTGANSSAIGLAGSTVNLWRVHAVHQGMSGDNSVIYSRAVYRRGKSNVTSKLSLDDCRVTNTSINPSGKNVGIEADDATALETTNVVVEVNGSDVSNIGIHLLGATTTALMSMTWVDATGSPNGYGLVMATGSLQHSVSAFGSTFEGSASAVDADYAMAVFGDTGFAGPRTDIESCHFLRCYDLGALAPISDTAAPVAP